jgi:hypothetical protein
MLGDTRRDRGRPPCDGAADGNKPNSVSPNPLRAPMVEPAGCAARTARPDPGKEAA